VLQKQTRRDVKQRNWSISFACNLDISEAWALLVKWFSALRTENICWVPSVYIVVNEQVLDESTDPQLLTKRTNLSSLALYILMIIYCLSILEFNITFRHGYLEISFRQDITYLPAMKILLVGVTRFNNMVLDCYCMCSQGVGHSANHKSKCFFLVIQVSCNMER
jgi:hypothetical protein